MAFIDVSATLGQAQSLSGVGMMSFSSSVVAAQSNGLYGNIIKYTKLKAARALTSNRIRLEFDASLSDTTALHDVRNYKILAPVGTSNPTVLSVDVPNQLAAKIIELEVSELKQGARYAITVNSADIVGVGPNLAVDGDMEAATTAAWTAFGGVLSKQSGARTGGTGVRILRNTGLGEADQVIPLSQDKAYRSSGWARTDGGGVSKAGFSLPNHGIVGMDDTVGNTTWRSFGPLYFDPGGTVNFTFALIQLVGGVYAEFDDYIVQEIQGTVNTDIEPIRDIDGIEVLRVIRCFVGIGVVPKIQVVISTGKNTAVVRFTEPVRATGDVAKLATYSFNLGLTVQAVLDVDANEVTLQTSNQTAGQLYTLTVNGVILDDANNQLVLPATSPMLGFIEAATPEALLNLVMYNFLTEGLRAEDQDRGLQFIQRFFTGPQNVWEAIVKTIFDVPKLWSTTEIPDRLLEFLKTIVGWTRDLDHITIPLDYDTLRRLIAASAQFWRERGPEDAIEDIIRLTTGARLYLLNWFDLRWIMDEAGLGEEYEGSDPWVLSTPNEGAGDSQTYEIRIVDDGSLNRDLVRALAKLTRPSGERILIMYLLGLDLFEVDGDTAQWDVTNVTTTPGSSSTFDTTFDDSFGGSGGTPSGVVNHVFQLIDTATAESTYMTANSASLWESCVFSMRAKGTGVFSIYFYRTASTDTYRLRVTLSTSVVELIKIVANVSTTLATIDTDTLGQHIYSDVYYGWRVQITPEKPGGANNVVKVYVDGLQILGVTVPADHVQGSVGFGHDTGGTMLVDLIEIFKIPVESDYIDINS